MSLESSIEDIKNGIKNNIYNNEQSISQGIILRILNDLNWPIYETFKVMPEYKIEGIRVDFALCIYPNKPIIFIEAKQLNNLQDADEQLFQYSYKLGVPLSILTDGKEWNFYLPTEVGAFNDRRLYKLNILERDTNEVTYILKRYLGFENSKSGKNIEDAKADYKNIRKEREADSNIPIAWMNLLEDEDEILIDLISDKVEDLCGYKPSNENIIKYLKALKKDEIIITNFKKSEIQISTSQINIKKSNRKKNSRSISFW